MLLYFKLNPTQIVKIIIFLTNMYKIVRLELKRSKELKKRG